MTIARRSAKSTGLSRGEIDAILQRLDPAQRRVLVPLIEPPSILRERRRFEAKHAMRALATEFYGALSTASRRACAKAIAADLARATTWRWLGARSAGHHKALLEIVEIYDGSPLGAEAIRKMLE